MNNRKKIHDKVKANLHPRNQHRERYDFQLLLTSSPELKPYVKFNAYDDLSIDFFNPNAVKALNKALLKHYYAINNWDIPKNYLCPPIPGRADYIHYIADLLASCNNGEIPTGNTIKCLDIGVGANCIYPLIGNKEYSWSFIASDIDPIAVQSANKIIKLNPQLKGKIEIRLQNNSNAIFQNIIQNNERIDVSLCNPPFHRSAAEAQAGTLRKLKNLTGKTAIKPILNFGGKQNELWCEGGEKRFIQTMINQSKQFSTSVFWFTTLVAQEAHLKSIYLELEKVQPVEVKTILMSQGNKTSRIVAWTFLSNAEQKQWIKRWCV